VGAAGVGEPGEVRGVAVAHPVPVRMPGEALGGVGPDGLQHPVAAVALPVAGSPLDRSQLQQALVAQAVEPLRHIRRAGERGRKRGHRVEGEPAGEHPQVGEQPQVRLVEQVHAPVDRPAQGLLPAGQVLRPAPHVEPAGQLGQQLRRCHRVAVCGGELDRQWQPVQPQTQVYRGGQLVGHERERVVRRPGPGVKQGQRRRLGERGGHRVRPGREAVEVRQGQRRHRVDLLAVQHQPLAAAHQDA
jgi:hypothetical protein